MFTHPLKKKILKRMDSKLDEVVAEHEAQKERLEGEFSDQVSALTAAHTGRLERLEEDTLNRF